MIRFPIIRRLTISGYELYPSSLKKPFIIDFSAGPNVIVGVNGSGKSTFIGICMRCITGPFDLPAATSESELGQVRAKAVAMSRRDRQVFGQRVADGAANASASLEVAFGSKVLAITRRLSDLTLTRLEVDGYDVSLPKSGKEEDAEFQAIVADCFGVGAFFDVLIILRFLTFMMEDRRALVWDASAQRQIFRVLMLPPDRAREYAEAQQSVISADSALRNTNQMINRQRQERALAATRTQKIASAEAQRRIMISEADALRERLERCALDRVEADEERNSYRQARLKAVESRESSIRELERIKMETLRRWLDPSQDTLRYILGHLLAEGKCLVCEADPSPAAEEIEKRLREGSCPVCGTKHVADDPLVPMGELDKARIHRLEEEVKLADEQIADADDKLDQAQLRLTSSENEYNDLESRRLALDRQMVALLRTIPTERAAVATADDHIISLESIATQDRLNLSVAEKRFQLVVSEAVKKVQTLQHQIADSFSSYLNLFLKETASLIYQTVSAKVGQGGGGARFNFPAFKLSMTGGSISGQTVRESPTQVSQSQAEFVDLAFRMALMSIASVDNAATLVVDAPEASLDFLFAERAGSQLAAFSWKNPNNRVIITSYLPSVHLVNSFLDRVPKSRDRRSRIVDLITLAADNAALRADRPRYKEFLDRIISNKETTSVSR